MNDEKNHSPAVLGSAGFRMIHLEVMRGKNPRLQSSGVESSAVKNTFIKNELIKCLNVVQNVLHES